MNTIEINHLLRDYSDCFVGTFPRDRLPQSPIKIRPFSLIMNTDISSKTGEHWVSIFVDSQNRAEYFDSFGRAPHYNEIVKFLARNNITNLTYNTHQVQNALTATCGLYCVLCIKFRCGGLSFEEFIKHFLQNTISNDLKAYISLLL